MALNGNRTLYSATTIPAQSAGVPLRRTFPMPSWNWPSPKTHSLIIVSATNKVSSARTGKFDSKNRRNMVPTKEDEEEESSLGGAKFKDDDSRDGVKAADGAVGNGFVMPELPGEKPDFWEGSQWDAFGFFIEYLWAFGVVFALVACGVAVVTYNQGATDFKDTPVYKEAIQSRDLLEEPDSSNADVFESNPTEQAPSLE